jgi:hypothetical protein
VTKLNVDFTPLPSSFFRFIVFLLSCRAGALLYLSPCCPASAGSRSMVRHELIAPQHCSNLHTFQSASTTLPYGPATRTLPLELVYDIILYAWLSPRTDVAKPYGPATLYPALSLVSRGWRETTLKIAWEHVVCRNMQDFQLYLALLVQHIWEERFDELLNTTRRTRSGAPFATVPGPSVGRRLAYVKTDSDMNNRILLVVQALPLSPSPFRNSHFHLDLSARAHLKSVYSVLSRHGIWSRDVGMRSALSLCTGRLFDDTKALTMRFRRKHKSQRGKDVVKWAHSFASLTELVIHDAPHRFFAKVFDPLHPRHCFARVERMTFSFRDTAEPGQDPGWESFRGLTPAVTHLTLGNPSPLKYAVGRLPRRLRSLVLKAKPTEHGPTIEGWALPEAASAGLLRRELGAGSAPVVIISGCSNEPLGWPETLVDARAHGLRLEIQRVVAG